MPKTKAPEAVEPSPSPSPLRSNYTTSYRDGTGRLIHAARHNECEGRGCEACNGLGFTKTYGD